ncbi:MAG: IPT/TIG domain-containing protein [bacterium]
MNKKASILLAALIMFNVDPGYDIQNREQIEAELRFTSNHAYFYVEKNVWQADWQSYLQALAKEFDETVYPKLTENYGKEWKPGIDNDSRITILITPMTDQAGGYFNPNDGFPKSEISKSNQREMFYLNSSNITSPLFKSFLAHEFQHLINFYQKKKLRWLDEEVWLNEALSEYAPTLCGYDQPYEKSNLETRVKSFLRDSSNSLTEWLGNMYDYGAINLFAQYLVDQRGVEVLKQITNSNTTGIKAVDNFEQIFSDWSVANYLNNCDFDDGKYCYKNKNLDFHVPLTANYNLLPITSLSISSITKEWSPHWYKISGISQESKTLKIDFKNNSEANFFIPYLIIDKNGQFVLKSLTETSYLPKFGQDINSVIIIPASDAQSNFSLTASIVQLPAPIIETIKPNKTYFGQQIIITGKNFIENISVRFGNQQAEQIELINSETIKVTAPDLGLLGKVNLSVINPDDQASLALDGFEYIKKELTPEELKAELKAKIAEIQLRILELQRDWLLIKIEETKTRIAVLLNQ